MPLSKHIEKSIKNMLVAQVTRIPNSFAWPHNNGICLVKSASKYLFQTKNVPTEKPVELDMEVSIPKKDSILHLESHA